MDIDSTVVAIVGLGYVGLPLAVEFAKHFPVIGFDIAPERVRELQAGHDKTLEVGDDELAGATKITFSSDADSLRGANVYVVTAPTPVDAYKRPDLEPLLRATEVVAQYLASGDVVIYESTVFPGATEEECVPRLAEISGLRFNQDFFVGYSPERINPGDRQHRLPTIAKITSGSTPQAAAFIGALYSTIIPAGIHPAPSIRVAEAAKVIENTQRDVNIALVNELAILFDKLGIDTGDVLEAARTKWNFLDFRPGLVGGHCIGVDPYYLTHKAQQVGHHPEMILAGRRTNDSMGGYVVSRLVKRMSSRGLPISGARVLVLGITFKENTPDIRNSQVVGIVRELQEYGMQVDVHDGWADPAAVLRTCGVRLEPLVPNGNTYSAVIVAVPHREYVRDGATIMAECLEPGGVVIDIRGVLDRTTPGLDRL